MEDFENIRFMSAAGIVAALGKRYREYRLAVRMTQKEVSEQSGVSVLTIRRFESGKVYNITMSNFVALLIAIGYVENIPGLLPEIPVSPYAISRLRGKLPKRVKHAKRT